MKNKCTSWFLCGRSFWNGFFKPKHRIVFVILFMVVLGIFYTLCYVLLALYYEALCTEHANAFLVFFFSNLFYILVGVQILHFLAVNPKQLTLLRCTLLFAGVLGSLCMSIAALALWAFKPPNDDIKNYVVKFLKGYNRVPRMYAKLQQDSKCCGINNFTDYAEAGTMTLKRLPESCCKKITKDCANFRGPALDQTKNYTEIIQSGKFYTKGCFATSTFENLQKESPSAYRSFHWIVDWAFISPILISILLGIFCYYAFYKLPREKDKPQWADEEFKEKLKERFSINKKSLKEVSFSKFQKPSMDSTSTTQKTSSTGTSTSSTSANSASTIDSIGTKLIAMSETKPHSPFKENVEINMDTHGKMVITATKRLSG